MINKRPDGGIVLAGLVSILAIFVIMLWSYFMRQDVVFGLSILGAGVILGVALLKEE